MGRAYRPNWHLDWICGRSGDAGILFESDSYQRDFHWQQSRSRGHDSGDNTFWPTANKLARLFDQTIRNVNQHVHGREDNQAQRRDRYIGELKKLAPGR
jgi:hypothetical protein